MFIWRCNDQLGNVFTFEEKKSGDFWGPIGVEASRWFTLDEIIESVLITLPTLTGDASTKSNSDFEFYRFDVAPAAAVPEISTWGMMGIGFAFVGLFGMRKA